MRKEINIGMIGFGTVGAGTVEVLQDNAKEIASRLGCPLRLKTIFSRNIHNKKTEWVKSGTRLTSNLHEILEDPEIDIVIELIGGLEPAKQIILEALKNKKSVVTANKLLLAECWGELMQAARANDAILGIEASVAGSIPILRVIEQGLVGDRVNSMYGILNGTTNYILSEMERTGHPLLDILRQAQEKGYAEADPTLDIEGYDTRYKLSILAQLGFGQRINYKDIIARGISRITPIDFKYAYHLGCTIKLLAIAERFDDEKLALSVQPVLVPRSNILAKVEGAFNAILIRGAKSGDSMYYGKGAGGAATGVAVVSDIVSIARNIGHGNAKGISRFGGQEDRNLRLAGKEDVAYRYYLRFVVYDQPGIIAKLGEILAKFEISIDAILQEAFDDKKNLPFVITLEKVSEAKVERAMEEMNKLEFLREAPLLLRIYDMQST